MKILILFSLILLLQGCEIKGANDPYAYAPEDSHSIWIPTPKAAKRLPASELSSDLADYTEFSKEKPLTLAEMIDIALYYNPSTKKSWARARMTAAEYGQSLQSQFIQAEIDGDYSRQRYAEFLGTDRGIVYETQYGGQLALSYLILDFGQSRATSEAALQSLYNADWSHNKQIQKVIQLIMNDYYSYLYEQELLYAAEQDAVDAKVSLDATEERFQNGLADVSDIVQAKTRYLKQKLHVVSQKQSLHNAYTKLISQMGLPSSKPLYFLNYPPEIKPFHLEDLDALILKANRNRPDLMAAEAKVKSSEQKIKAAQLKNYPTINSALDVGRQYYQHGVNDTYDFNAALSLNFPLFQGFFIENTVKKAKAEYEESKADLEEVQIAIIEEVANYRSDTQYACESLTYSEAYLESALEDFKVNLARYKVGTGTIVDLINAQTAVADARAKVAKAQNSWFTSVANLAYATGILLPPKNQEQYENTSF